MRLKFLFVPFVFLSAAAGCGESDCGEGFAKAADGNCYPVAGDDTSVEADADTDADADSDSDSDADSDSDSDADSDSDSDADSDADSDSDADGDTDADADSDPTQNFSESGNFTMSVTETQNGLGSDTCSGTAYTNQATGNISGLYQCNFSGPFSAFGTTMDDFNGTVTGTSASGDFGVNTPFLSTWSGTFNSSTNGLDSASVSGTFTDQSYGGTFTASFKTQ